VEEIELGEALEALANQLVWRIGKLDDEGEVVVRVGYATALPAFAALPRLRAVTDAELEAARQERRIRIEWIRSPAPLLHPHSRSTARAPAQAGAGTVEDPAAPPEPGGSADRGGPE
jgi:hypothetical protein